MNRLLMLVLAAAVLTLGVSIARLTGEVQGWIPPQSGGALHPLGISWLVFLFGAVFGIALQRKGSAPRVPLAPLWALLCMAAVVGSVAWQFGPFLKAEATAAVYERLRPAVLTLAGIGTVLAIVGFVIWPRLALMLLAYGLLARGIVLGITWLAKASAWETHYTKFGPPGIEVAELSETMFAASIAQLGFWVPYTIVGGMLAGCVFGLLGRPRRVAQTGESPPDE